MAATAERTAAVTETTVVHLPGFIPSLLLTILENPPKPLVPDNHSMIRVIRLSPSGNGQLSLAQEWYTVEKGTQVAAIQVEIAQDAQKLPEIRVGQDELCKVLAEAGNRQQLSVEVADPPTAVVFSSEDGSRWALGTWAMPKPITDNNP